MHIHSIEELQQLVSFLGFNSVYYLFLVCICRPILDMLEWFLGYCVCVSTSYYMPPMAYGIYCTRPRVLHALGPHAVNDAVRHWRRVVNSLSQEYTP